MTYRLRDWLLSRQRYWGCPIPMVKCATHGYQPVPDAELPVRLPDDVTLAEGARSPLAAHPTWSARRPVPTCGGPATRETDTMDGFMESSWYELRYCSPHTSRVARSRSELGYWMNVDQYIGGAEHATKHLIYARFFTKMLRDWGWIPKNIDEPFARLLEPGHGGQGDVSAASTTTTCIRRRSKTARACTAASRSPSGAPRRCPSRSSNVVEPLALIEKYGADTVRIFSLFAAPPDSMLEWSDAGVEGAWRFLNRVYRMVEKYAAAGFAAQAVGGAEAEDARDHQARHRGHRELQVQHGDRGDHGAGERHLRGDRRSTARRSSRWCACWRRWRRTCAKRCGGGSATPRAEMLVTHPWPTCDPGAGGEEAHRLPGAGQRQAARAARGRAGGGAGGGRVAGARARLGQAVDRRQGGGQGRVRAGAPHQLRRPCVAARCAWSIAARSVGCATPEYARHRRQAGLASDGRLRQRPRRFASSTGAPSPASSIRRAAATSTTARSAGGSAASTSRFDAVWYGARLMLEGRGEVPWKQDFTHTEGLFSSPSTSPSSAPGIAAFAAA